MEQTHAPQQQQEASSFQSERENKKQLSRIPMDIMRSLSGADANGADVPPNAGKRLSLSDAMQAKMQRAFGLDMSGVRLYENPAVRDVGANALAQGDTVSFAPGKADFSSRSGQALLGHELSHIASQARGEVRGNGLLLDSSLEARADREGAMAAAGKQVAPPSAELVSAAPMAASPVQGDFSKAPEDMLKRKPKHGNPFKKFPRFRYLSSKPSRFKPSRIPSFGKGGKGRGRGGGGGGNNFNFTNFTCRN